MAGADNKNRKYGRSSRSPSKARYDMEGRKKKNRLRRMKRHAARHPNDLQTARAIAQGR